MPAVLANRQADRPHAFKLVMNGKKMPIVLPDGPDDYNDFPAGKLTVVAKWRSNAAGRGTFVRISTSEPDDHIYAACFKGTACRVRVKVPLLLNREMSWALELVTNRGHKVVKAYKVCLVGR